MNDYDEIKARLDAMMPLFQEARDALTALTTAQVKLHGISPTLADRMDDVGIPARWKARRIARENEERESERLADIQHGLEMRDAYGDNP